MKTKNVILALLLSTASMLASAADISAKVSEEQYRKAIASFGVSHNIAETASKEAVRLIEERSMAEARNHTRWMAELPANWLDDTSY